MWIVQHFERDGRHRLAVRRFPFHRLLSVEAVALHRRNVQRRRQKVDDGIKQMLHALVLEGGARQHRCDLALNRPDAQASNDFIFGEFLAVEILLHDHIVKLGGRLDIPLLHRETLAGRNMRVCQLRVEL